MMRHAYACALRGRIPRIVRSDYRAERYSLVRIDAPHMPGDQAIRNGQQSASWPNVRISGRVARCAAGTDQQVNAPMMRHAYACVIHGRTDGRTYGDACISERRDSSFETRGRAYGDFRDSAVGR